MNIPYATKEAAIADLAGLIEGYERRAKREGVSEYRRQTNLQRLAETKAELAKWQAK
jgi:hypothetical protein